MNKKITGNILTPQGFVEGEIIFAEKIISVTGKKILSPSPQLPIIIPGFIDLHVHGAGGSDIMDGKNAFLNIGATLLRYGTTSMLATTMTASHQIILQAIRDLKPYHQEKKSKLPRILGIHLEGPFINEGKKGAHPPEMRAASLDEIEELHQIVPLKIITIAPEIPTHIDIIKKLKDRFVFQVGHTNATFDETNRAMDAGSKSFTHLFNAMSALHHREPGAVGAALLRAEYSEMIPDLLHVHPGAIKLALKNIPSLYFVTDSTAATGMPDGPYKLGSQSVEKCMGGVRLKDGTLAGSCLTMDEAFRNLIQIGLSLEEASHRLSTVPATLIKENKRGSLVKDFFSDILVFDHSCQLQEVYSEGEKF